MPRCVASHSLGCCPCCCLCLRLWCVLLPRVRCGRRIRGGARARLVGAGPNGTAPTERMGVGTYMGRQRASRFAHVCGGRFHAECRFEFIPLSLYVYIKNTSRVRIVRWYQAAAKRLRLILHRSMIYRRHPPRVRHRRLTGRTRVSPVVNESYVSGVLVHNPCRSRGEQTVHCGLS